MNVEKQGIADKLHHTETNKTQRKEECKMFTCFKKIHSKVFVVRPQEDLE